MAYRPKSLDDFDKKFQDTVAAKQAAQPQPEAPQPAAPATDMDGVKAHARSAKELSGAVQSFAKEFSSAPHTDAMAQAQQALADEAPVTPAQQRAIRQKTDAAFEELLDISSGKRPMPMPAPAPQPQPAPMPQPEAPQPEPVAAPAAAPKDVPAAAPEEAPQPGAPLKEGDLSGLMDDYYRVMNDDMEDDDDSAEHHSFLHRRRERRRAAKERREDLYAADAAEDAYAPADDEGDDENAAPLSAEPVLNAAAGFVFAETPQETPAVPTDVPAADPYAQYTQTPAEAPAVVEDEVPVIYPEEATQPPADTYDAAPVQAAPAPQPVEETPQFSFGSGSVFDAARLFSDLPSVFAEPAASATQAEEPVAAATPADEPPADEAPAVPAAPSYQEIAHVPEYHSVEVKLDLPAFPSFAEIRAKEAAAKRAAAEAQAAEAQAIETPAAPVAETFAPSQAAAAAAPRVTPPTPPETPVIEEPDVLPTAMFEAPVAEEAPAAEEPTAAEEAPAVPQETAVYSAPEKEEPPAQPEEAPEAPQDTKIYDLADAEDESAKPYLADAEPEETPAPQSETAAADDADPEEYPEEYPPEEAQPQTQDDGYALGTVQIKEELERFSVKKKLAKALVVLLFVVSLLCTLVLGLGTMLVGINTGEPGIADLCLFTASYDYTDANIKSGDLVIGKWQSTVRDGESVVYIDLANRSFSFGVKSGEFEQDDTTYYRISGSDIKKANLLAVVERTVPVVGIFAKITVDHFATVFVAFAVATVALLLLLMFAFRRKRIYKKVYVRSEPQEIEQDAPQQPDAPYENGDLFDDIN